MFVHGFGLLVFVHGFGTSGDIVLCYNSLFLMLQQGRRSVPAGLPKDNIIVVMVNNKLSNNNNSNNVQTFRQIGGESEKNTGVRSWSLFPDYYGFQRLCYIVFLEYLGNYLLDHYDALPQYVSHPPLIFGSIVHYQRGVSKAHTLDT